VEFAAGGRGACRAGIVSVPCPQPTIRGFTARQEPRPGGVIELEGTPDMILEIVSEYSEPKDTQKLRALYEKTRIPEYWLVDARNNINFEMLRLTNNSYQSVVPDQGWLKSDVFGCSFQLARGLDPLGKPQFFVNVK
jgi:Uma2 family endonuclease